MGGRGCKSQQRPPPIVVPKTQSLEPKAVIVALTRSVPASIHRCELTHLEREPIDYARALREHEVYERCLAEMGCVVERLPDTPDLPDSVFVEDTALVFDDLAVMARPGAASRRAEVVSAAEALRTYRRVVFIQPPGTLDGGDVLVTATTVFVGISARTNADGARQLAAILTPAGRRVLAVPVRGGLHLKSAVTAVSDQLLLVNPAWVDSEAFPGFECAEIDPVEPYAANVLRIGRRVMCAAEFPRTRKRLEALGIVTTVVHAGELAKAEGGLTCGCLLLSQSS